MRVLVSLAIYFSLLGQPLLGQQGGIVQGNGIVRGNGIVSPGGLFSHTQGGHDFTTALPGTACHPSLGSTPSAGDVVVVGVVSGSGADPRPVGLTVADGNSNSYLATTNTPDVLTINGVPVNEYIFYFIVTGSPSSTINIAWGTSTVLVCWADEFHKRAGTITFDKDSAGAASVCSGTSATSPSIVPAGNPGLAYSVGIDPDNSFVAPVASTPLGSWTGTQGGPETIATGANSEYNLSASGSTGVNYTCGVTGDNYGAMSAAWE